MNTTAPKTPQRTDRRRRILAVALAVLAVGGVGAAATSAAWTDNVFASSGVDAATFDLQGSLTGAENTWVQSDKKDAVELALPAGDFANMLPGQTRKATFQVKNTGSTPAALTVEPAWAHADGADGGFATNPTVTAVAATDKLTPGSAATTITVTVTTPADWSPENKGTGDTLVVTVAGTAVEK